MSSSTIFAVGVVSRGDGDFAKRWRDGSIALVGQCPPSAYASEQPSAIPVLLWHEYDKGAVLHLERSGGCLYAVCEVVAGVRDEGPLAFSPGITAVAGYHRQGYDSEVRLRMAGARLNHLALTPTPASVNLPPIVLLDRLDEHPTGISDRLHRVALNARDAIRARPFRAVWERARPLSIVDPELDADLAEFDDVLARVAAPAPVLAREEVGYSLRPLRRTFPTAITMLRG